MKRTISLILTVSLLVSIFAISVYADPLDENGDTGGTGPGGSGSMSELWDNPWQGMRITIIDVTDPSRMIGGEQWGKVAAGTVSVDITNLTTSSGFFTRTMAADGSTALTYGNKVTHFGKRDFLNFSANTGVKIRKTGNYEVMSGDIFKYDIKEVQNTSNVPLTDFYWRDTLPTNALRLTKIFTGTYNQSLKYKVIATTNKGDTKVLADNLSTTQNNVIDCLNPALGLANDEYITSFSLLFGTVKAGFSQVTTPQIYVTVQPNLPNGYQFANKVDVAGRYLTEWVAGNAVWTSSVYAPPVKLPRTGY
jgi:hypothetical protein